MSDYRKLKVWRHATDLKQRLIARTNLWPPSLRYELTTQTRRAARSIHDNLAEGSAFGRGDNFARFIRMSIASASELENHLSSLGMSRCSPQKSAKSYRPRCARSAGCFTDYFGGQPADYTATGHATTGNSPLATGY